MLEPSVDLRWAARPADLADADLVVLPGSRTAVSDLDWLRSRGLDDALQRLAADPAGPHLLGIGAGYELLGNEVDDEIESGRGRVAGLGLLPARTAYAAPKTVRRVRGQVSGPSAVPITGYQAGWGRTFLTDGAHPWFELGDVGPEGCLSDDGRVRGTSVHGLLDADELRHSLLGAVAAGHGRSFAPSPVPYTQALDEHLEHLADWVQEHLDVDRLLALAHEALPVGQEPGW